MSRGKHFILFLLPSLVALCSASSVVAESAWTDPHPLRLEGFQDGRRFTYNTESFLHRYSYRNLSDFPQPGMDGVYGTGGSITGDELYVEINLQKTFYFDSGLYSIVGRMQRREDFDGRFDRQLMGFTRRFGGNWSASLVGDISADKGSVNFQYELDWRPSATQYLRSAIIQTDRLYNNKSDSNNKYRQTPLTYFIHYRQSLLGSGHMETAVNYSPGTRYDDFENGFLIDAEQLRWMGEVRVPVTDGWHSGLRVEMENSSRDFTGLEGPGQTERDNFRRRMHHIVWSVDAAEKRWAPRFGLRHFRLDESGWFGEIQATEGSNYRNESSLFIGGTYRGGENHWWEPALHVSRVKMKRDFTQNPLEYRNRDEWVAKLTLPWRYVVNRQAGAVVTVNPTFRVHEFAFGGGNVQLHWPL